ncbi:HK97 family phage prohead protease [Bradyrhizobium sp. USDA 4452]
MITRETRSFSDFKVESRDDGPKIIIGYAAVFNSPADIGGYFREQVAPGAFTRAIAEDDVVANINHEDWPILGRNTAGTLKLSQDERGLRVEISPPDTRSVRELITALKRGDISKMSFAFRATKEQWDETVDPPLRTLQEVELLDVSIVTRPAYDDTEVGVRMLTELRAKNTPPAGNTARRLRMKHALNERTRLAR